MPRTTVVEKAQQRYYTKPVIDPETGEQKQTPVMRNGEQRTTKRGKPIFMKVTERDLDRPKPNLRCDFPGCDIDGGEILPGTAYKHITPKSGPYGGTQRNRHKVHRGWYQWEYSSSLGARLAQVAHNFSQALESVESEDDVQSALDDAASEIESIAEEKREGASNIEDGFGHATTASEELEEIAGQLEDWAEEIKAADIPELPEPEERYFIDGPDGSRHGDDDGYETEDDARSALTGMLEDLIDSEDDETTEDDFTIVGETPDEPSEEQLDEWRSEVSDALTIVDESPV